MQIRYAYHLHEAGIHDKSFVNNKKLARFSFKVGDFDLSERCYLRAIDDAKQMRHIEDAVDCMKELWNVYLERKRFGDARKISEKIRCREIVLKVLESSKLIDEFNEKNIDPIVEAVHLNLREAKRFINNIILARTAFDKPIDELIVVQAFNFRRDWNRFLELITPDESRKQFLSEYKKLKERVTSEQDLDKLSSERPRVEPLTKNVLETYREFLKHGESLSTFLEAGAADILLNITDMKEYRRVLSTTKIPTDSHELLKLLFEGKVVQFNNSRLRSTPTNYNFSSAKLSHLKLEGINLSGVNLSNANLSYANLSGAILIDANLSNADLSNAILMNATLSEANLSYADLSNAILMNATLSEANLSHTILKEATLSETNLPDAKLPNAVLSGAHMLHADFSNADLSSAILIGCGQYLGLKCEDADFKDAVIDEDELSDYLRKGRARNVPNALKNKKELKDKLRQKGLIETEIKELLSYSSLC